MNPFQSTTWHKTVCRGWARFRQKASRVSSRFPPRPSPYHAPFRTVEVNQLILPKNPMKKRDDCSILQMKKLRFGFFPTM